MAQTGATAPKKGSILLWIGLLVVVVGGGLFAYAKMLPGKTTAADPVVAHAEPQQLKLEAFTVNLADASYNRYLRSTIILEYLADVAAVELEEKNYRIRDAVISVLRSRRAVDLDEEAELENLRQQLLDRVNGMLTRGKVTGLYFTELLIQ